MDVAAAVVIQGAEAAIPEGVVDTLGAADNSNLRVVSRARRNGRLRPMTDTPVCIGIGVSTPEQAADVCGEADGVVVGSALVRRLLDGEGPKGAAAFVGALRAGIDAGH